MGECPDWYPLLKAARYMGVAPWELAERPIAWQEWALMAESAEISAANQQSALGGGQGGRKRGY